jgi:hypothetical protein
MYDFIRELNTKQLVCLDRDKVYEVVMDATTTHFEDTDKALAFPMIWSVVENYLNQRRSPTARFITTAKEVWFEKQNI